MRSVKLLPLDNILIPSGLSRHTRCACLIKETDVYKCKHSISFTHSSLDALRCLLGGAHWLQASLALVKPSVKPNSIGVQRHFIFGAWTCALQTNPVLCDSEDAL